MNKKLIYTITLVLFFLMWGAYGFVSAPQNVPAFQATLPSATAPVNVTVIPGATSVVVVPVTGANAPSMWTLLFYGLIGLLVLFLVIGLLASANRTTTTTTYTRREGPLPPPDEPLP